MNSDIVRLNITLPLDLAKELDKVTGARKRSRFISEAIQLMLKKKQKEELDCALEEGYRASARESLSLTEEFEAADLEDWDEY